MKSFKLIFLLLTVCTSLFGQAKKIASGNEVTFKIKNSGINVDGSFKGVTGTIIFDTKDLPKSSFDVTIDAGTVNTGNNTRDGHLKKKEYFDVATFSKIRFQSKKITQSGNGFIIIGNLTLKGKTKEVSIPFTYSENNNAGVFNGNFKLNRLDYNVGESSWILSDDVTIFLNIKSTNQ